MKLIKDDYYEEEFRYKNRDELKSIISMLKYEIEQLKNILEHPCYTNYPDIETHPYRERLVFAQESLKRAIGVYKQSGGQYEPTQEEINAQLFDELTPYINKLVVTVDNHIMDTVIYTATLEKDEFRLTRKFNMPDHIEECSFIKKQEFIDKISQLRIGEWRRNYSLSRFGYPDDEAIHWDLEISFSTDDYPLRIHGAGVHPYNYLELLCMFNPKFISEYEKKR